MNSIPRSGDTKFEVLATVVDHWSEARFGPTVDEIRVSVGLNARSTVQFHINDLCEQGWLEKIDGKRRTLRPTKRGSELVKVMRRLNETSS